MKFNRGGLICVGLYASYVLFILAVTYLAIDDKTRGFFVALSALPAGWSSAPCRRRRWSGCWSTIILALPAACIS